MNNLFMRWPFFIMSAIGIMGFLVGQLLEDYFGIKGCLLCHIERWVLLAGGIFSLLAGMFLSSVFGLLMAYDALFAWIGGSLTALYHAGVQYHLFPLPPFCSVQDAQTLTEFLSMSKISCDQRTLELFSVPASVYLSILFAVLSMVCINVLRKRFI